MQISKLIKSLFILTILISSISFTSCKKKDVYEYGVNQETILPNNVGKTRLKTNDQFAAILYANLFQKALSTSQIYQISQAMDSKGDQILARQLIISNFMGKPGVIMPTNTEMRADIPKFVEETFIRFYIRRPTEAEKAYLSESINTDPRLTPELVYFAFALSDEYMYY